MSRYLGNGKPFLKWPGGKRWLVSDHSSLFPTKFGKYIEPFLGGGSVFFNLSPRIAILGDVNQRLIDCYFIMKHHHQELYKLLKLHHEHHTREYYYAMRSAQYDTLIERAAQFIYLNRTCWNGLYRVNLDGTFNVPIGTKRSVVFEGEDFGSYASALSRASLICSDFEGLINKAMDGDFLFVDPPYTVKHNLNGFTKYNEKIFMWEDQVRLSNAIKRAAKRGAQVLLANAYHKSVADLYRSFSSIIPISRHSVLAADSAFREKIQEAIICVNFVPPGLG